MKKTLFLLLFFVSFQSIFAQNMKKYKIVFQLTSNDTLVHKALVKQLNNALNEAPNTKLEVVCHNNGITFLQNTKTKQAEAIVALKAKGVDFAACQNTMKERKIEVSEIVSEARFVPAGIIEIADKQSKKWAYIKAGF
jgi:intracellular sulfur oxidation DsrE/DsrF family protein